MAKEADYLISGLWKSNGEVTHYLLHEMTKESSWKVGEKKTVQEIIDLIESKKTIKTVRWRYAQIDWNIGALIQVVNVDGKKHLRTKGDAIISDNLANLIRLNAIR